MKQKLRVGIIGCGKISDAYFEGCRAFDVLEIVACSDLNLETARAKAQQHTIEKAVPVDELLADPAVDIVVNLTIPQAHVEVNLRAIEAGKHVFCEKPFALNFADGERVLAAAKNQKVLIGCAPDTFLGTAMQTCRKIIDEGGIGEPIGATAFTASHGPEGWHPNPEFFYKPGGGPMFDMGPYYLTALINLLGPIRRVCGSTRISFPRRIIGSQPFAGKMIEVATPTHLTGVADFVSGAVGTVIMSFDVWKTNLPPIEIFGSEATLSVPDPNMTTGTVTILRLGEEPEDVPLTHAAGNPFRGIGVADLASAILNGRRPRTDGQMANHVVEVMQSFEASSQTGRHIEIQSRCERPEPLAAGLPIGKVE